MNNPREKKIGRALTIKIHPDLLKEIDLHIDGIKFRSRAHFIECAVVSFIEQGPKLKPSKFSRFKRMSEEGES